VALDFHERIWYSFCSWDTCVRRLFTAIIKQLRVNERIIAREVRLVGENSEQLGVMTLAAARELAKKANLDIVEVAPTSVPPVCRLLDYGKFKYEQQKKDQQSKKAQKVTLLREIRLRPKIGVHDFEFKARTAKKLLMDGAKVKITLMFRGREITHPDLGWKILQKMAETLKEAGALERQPLMEGRRMDIILAPITNKPKPKQEVKPAGKAADNKTGVKAAGKVPSAGTSAGNVPAENITAIDAGAGKPGAAKADVTGAAVVNPAAAVKTIEKETQNAKT
jgi:translation initiation factor IF-3